MTSIPVAWGWGIAIIASLALTIGVTTVALRRSRGATKAHAALGDDVLIAVAHDLRDPLHCLGATIALLEDASVPPECRGEMAAIARRAVGQMRCLIDDLLDSARAQAGGLALDLRTVSLGTLVAHVMETFACTTQERAVCLRAENSAPDAQVDADVERLQRALGNLLSNALKFTASGGEVVVRACVHGENAVIAVSDTGPGIQPEHVPRLFEPFWQARRGDQRGIGIGLAITKDIVEAHRGRVVVDSTPGVGSTFSIRLPLNRSGGRPASEHQLRPKSRSSLLRQS